MQIRPLIRPTFLGILSLIALMGCASLTKKEKSADVREVNPAIISVIAEKRQEPVTAYPDLADIPATAPEQLPPIQRAMNENGLLQEKNELEKLVALDVALAREERPNTLLAIAEGIQRAILKDQANAKLLAKKPMPKLGGSEPNLAKKTNLPQSQN